MIGIPVNSNSIYIPMIQTGCLKSEFDSTYPVHLNGIINQNEFQESINKINRAFRSFRTYVIICYIIFALAIAGGATCSALSGVKAVKPDKTQFYVLLGVGIAISCSGSLVLGFGLYFIYSKRVIGMREAIAEESMKYSSRSPIPCSWRLDTSRNWLGANRYYNNRYMAYHLVIDIGRSVAATNDNQMYFSNTVAPEPTEFSKRQDNYPSQSYSDQFVGFCPRCNALRQPSTAKFCSSCGQSFDKY